MLCDNCKERQANVHITKIINGEKVQLDLCEECAREYQQHLGFSFQPNFSFHKFLAGLLDQPGLAPGETGYQKAQKCPRCGMTQAEFIQHGKLGCDQCYETFENGLSPLIKRVHGRIKHTGKVPKRTGGDIRLKQQLEGLKKQLQVLVAQEEFEQAAKVRDKIKEVENNLRK